jgi:hypothetical protein
MRAEAFGCIGDNERRTIRHWRTYTKHATDQLSRPPGAVPDALNALKMDDARIAAAKTQGENKSHRNRADTITLVFRRCPTQAIHFGLIVPA